MRITVEYKNKEWLEEEYVNKQRSMLQIAKELGVSAMTVRKYIIKFGFSIRNKNQQRSLYYKSKAADAKETYDVVPRHELLRDKEWLEKEYVVNRLSLRQIAELCGIKSRRTVKKALKFHGIAKRSLKEARNARSNKGPELRKHKNPLVNDIGYLQCLYDSGMSIRSIADKLDIGYTTVIHRLNIADVKRRDPWEHRVGSKHSEETRMKMSETVAQQFVDGARKSYSNAQRATILFPDGSFRSVRSSYEKHYIKYLKTNNIPFEYENKSFELSNGGIYIPDFYLPDTDEYVEIKGYLSDEQSAKYELFRKEYPDIKWKMLFKHDLIELGINPKPFPDIYMLIGAPASGKSWVCNQILDQFEYISYDKNIKKNHLKLLRALSKKPKLYDPTFKISTIIRRHSDEFNFHIICIKETEDVLKERIANRGGKMTDTIMKRNKQVEKRYIKYGSTKSFIGTSTEVLEYLKKLPL